MEGKYNLKSTAVKRLMQEAKELNLPTEQYFAQPLEDNLFEWHFTVRGPPDSDFADGLYHGRIILPPEYPMKPPSIILLTPNGRFEINKKICLSISGHHPESWQPSWSIRTALLAIIGFMPTHGSGAIGALDYTKEERRVLALKSQNWVCSICNIPNKTLLLEPTGKNLVANQEAKELASQISFKGTDKTVPPAPSLSQPVFSPVLTQPFPNFNTPTSFVTPLFNASTSQNEDIAVADPSSNSVENLTNSPISSANSPSGQSINLQTTASLTHDIRHRHVRSTISNNSDNRPVTVPMNQPFARSRTLLYLMLILSIALITLVFRRLYSMNLFNLM